MYRLNIEESQMAALGDALAQGLLHAGGGRIYLDGTLGMGKTTLSQAIIAGCGWTGRVKSPTYTLVEPYECAALTVVHFDLYRLSDPEELEFIGIRDYLTDASVWLVEWPERGAGVLPPADVVIHFSAAGSARNLTFDARTERGQSLLDYVQLRGENA